MPNNTPAVADGKNWLTNLGDWGKNGLNTASNLATSAFKDTLQTAAANNSNFNPANPDTWGSYTQSISSAGPAAILNQVKGLDKNFAKILSDPTAAAQIQNGILTGNWSDVAATVVTGGVVPTLANTLVGYVSKKIKKALGITPPTSPDAAALLAEEMSISDYAPPSNLTLSIKEGNVGHKGSMTVSLGGITFEIPPAVQSMIPVGNHGSAHDTPGAGAGISFKHMQNYATMLIPGSSPVYQSLGIQGHMIEFVGVFLGFNRSRYLDKNKTGGRGTPDKTYNDNFNPSNPDPLYINDEEDKQYWGNIVSGVPGLGTGGAWGISKAFQYNVKNGIPQELFIDSGVSKIQYTVIVVSLDRIYQRDDRVYYKFQGLALGGDEKVVSNTKVLPTTKRLPKSSGRSNKTGNAGSDAIKKAVALSVNDHETIKQLKILLGNFDKPALEYDFNYQTQKVEFISKNVKIKLDLKTFNAGRLETMLVTEIIPFIENSLKNEDLTTKPSTDTFYYNNSLIPGIKVWKPFIENKIIFEFNTLYQQARIILEKALDSNKKSLTLKDSLISQEFVKDLQNTSFKLEEIQTYYNKLLDSVKQSIYSKL